ncbi:MAG: GNAT family N-acetyltransferase [Gammaproteobacteria bacterium]|nr:GNAT family N-acetyltransferase [Gammaproteobacteria bacterium]MDH3769122.1 GNAT family N-acetyltransferase [Gammaproteobacteria bacterium]
MTATALTLRLAVPQDAELIAAMSRSFVEDGLRWTWRPGKVGRQIAQRDTVVLVALDGRHLVGFAIMHYGDESAHLNLLAVHPEYRLTGVGRRMVRWLEKSARVSGVFSISLEVRAANTGARHFYETLGYCETARLHSYYQGIEDAVRMQTDLSVDPNNWG